MFGIIISIVAIVICVAGLVFNLVHKQYGWAFFFVFLTVINSICLYVNLDRYLSKLRGELETIKVENVVYYTVDTTTVINGMDTTQLYTITYQKEYE